MARVGDEDEERREGVCVRERSMREGRRVSGMGVRKAGEGEEKNEKVKEKGRNLIILHCHTI